MPLKVKGQQSSSVSRETEGNDVYIRAMRDGALIVNDWKQGLVLEGKAFMVNVGAFSSPITGGGNGDVIDIDQPEALIAVSSGTSLIPLRFHIACQTPLIASDSDESEILIAVDQDKAWAVDGTYTTETIYAMNTLKGAGTGCVVGSAFTADTTDPVLDLELAHAVTIGDVQATVGNALWGKLDLLYEPVNPPIINGPAMVCIYWGGTVATKGFASLSWAEVPTTSVST